MMHTVKGFSIVNEAEVDVILEFSCFFYDPMDHRMAILFLVPLPFLNPAWTKLGKEYVKAVYCHPACLTYMENTSCEILGWMKHKLESRLPGEILISSASVRSIPFLSFTEPIFAWNVPLVSLIFLKRSLVFPTLLFSSISLHWSLKKAFLSLNAILWNSAFRCLYLSFSPLLFTSLLFTAICKASPDSHFAFLHFFSMGMVLSPVSYTMSQTSFHVHQALYLSDLGP